MNRNFKRASIAMGIGGVAFLAGAVPLFMFSKAPENGWLPLGCGVIFLIASVAFWWTGRRTHPEA
jgi:hypothetical protein